MAGDPNLVLSPEELARQEAANYLASQGVPGYSAAPPPVPMASAVAEPPPAEMPPPPANDVPYGPPAPTFGDRLAANAKRTGRTLGYTAAGAALGGPVGAMYGLSKARDASMEELHGSDPSWYKPDSPEVHGPSAPPPPGAAADDSPLILNGQQGGGGQRMVAPAGMYPHSMTTQAHMGHAVPEEAKRAYGASSALELEGADKRAAADRDYYMQVRNAQEARLQANSDAITQHARVQAQRDDVVKQRMAQIEALNAEASAQIDPEKYWNDRGAGARILGAFAAALGQYAAVKTGTVNAAANVIENNINREIQAQIQNAQQKGNQAARQERLLDIHLAQLGDKDKAIDATRLGLYDNVLAQIDQYGSENKARVSEANLAALKGEILAKRGDLVNKMGLQEADDVNRAYSEQYRPAQYAGGGGTPAGKMEGYELIPVPASDRTAEKGQLIAVPKGAHEKLGAIVGATNTLVGINQEALERIQKIRKDTEIIKGKASGDKTDALARIQSERKALEDLAQRKASALSNAEGQGVLKEAEFERAMNDRVMFTDWWKPGVDVEQRIQAQNNSLTGAAGRMVQGYGGQRVKMAYTRDKNGALQPTPLFTGQMYTPAPVGPEMMPLAPVKGK